MKSDDPPTDQAPGKKSDDPHTDQGKGGKRKRGN